MQYLTYDEYKDMGGILDESAFKKNIDRAYGIIDWETHNRIEEMNIPLQVKLCCRDIVEYISENMTVNKIVSSESQSVGSLSESKSYKTKTSSEMYGDILNILFDYLMNIKTEKGTPILYRGYGND